MNLPADREVSRAVRRMAHIPGTASVTLQFTDGSIYVFEPFLDDDWIELSRRQAYPGLYFNHIVKPRPNFRSTKLRQWPEIGGDTVNRVLYWRDPLL